MKEHKDRIIICGFLQVSMVADDFFTRDGLL